MKSKFNKLFNLIIQQLTAQQKKTTDKYTKKRKYTDFGPLFQNQRTYFPLKYTESFNILVPPQNIVNELNNAGFYISDYRAGTAMKKSKPGQTKDLRQIKIGKILNRLNNPQLIKQFNERLGTSQKNIKNLKLQLCITHNPYDIAGMSTDRNWTSCMNLNDGAFHETAYRQVQYGGMCAYLINQDDKQINQPYARIAIKRMVGITEQNSFIFVSENLIYGDINLAEEFKMNETLIQILKQSNEQTKQDEISFKISDKKSYSDSEYSKYVDYNNIQKTVQNSNLSQKQIKDILMFSTLSINNLNNLITKYNLTQKKYWQLISEYQPLTIDFIKQNLNSLIIDKLCYNQKIDIITFANEFYLTLNNTQLDILFNTFKKQHKKIPLKIVQQYLIKNPNLSSYYMQNLLMTNSIPEKILQNYIDNYSGQEYQLADIFGLIAQFYIHLSWHFIEKYIKHFSGAIVFIFQDHKFTQEQFNYILKNMTSMLCYNITKNYQDTKQVFKNLNIQQQFEILYKAKNVYHTFKEDNKFNTIKEQMFLNK